MKLVMCVSIKYVMYAQNGTVGIIYDGWLFMMDDYEAALSHKADTRTES